MLRCYLDEVYSGKYGHSLRRYLKSRDFFTEHAEYHIQTMAPCVYKFWFSEQYIHCINKTNIPISIHFLLQQYMATSERMGRPL